MYSVDIGKDFDEIVEKLLNKDKYDNTIAMTKDTFSKLISDYILSSEYGKLESLEYKEDNIVILRVDGILSRIILNEYLPNGSFIQINDFDNRCNSNSLYDTKHRGLKIV